MQCNYYGYKVDRGFLKTSTLIGRPHLLERWGWVFKLEIYVGMSRERTIFPQLVCVCVQANRTYRGLKMISLGTILVGTDNRDNKALTPFLALLLKHFSFLCTLVMTHGLYKE